MAKECINAHLQHEGVEIRTAALWVIINLTDRLAHLLFGLMVFESCVQSMLLHPVTLQFCLSPDCVLLCASLVLHQHSRHLGCLAASLHAPSAVRAVCPFKEFVCWRFESTAHQQCSAAPIL